MARTKAQEEDWKDIAKAPAKDKLAKGTMLALRIPPTMHHDMHALALRLGAERGQRVLLTDLMVEALRDLFAKYKPKK